MFFRLCFYAVAMWLIIVMKFFKIFFILKYINIIFFYFLKFIFY
jgi:hypothetical protein